MEVTVVMAVYHTGERTMVSRFRMAVMVAEEVMSVFKHLHDSRICMN